MACNRTHLPVQYTLKAILTSMTVSARPLIELCGVEVNPHWLLHMRCFVQVVHISDPARRRRFAQALAAALIHANIGAAAPPKASAV